MMRSTRLVLAGLVVGALSAAGCGDDVDPLAQLNNDTNRDAGTASDTSGGDDTMGGNDGMDLPDTPSPDAGGDAGGAEDAGTDGGGTPDVGVDTTPGPDSGGGDDAGSFVCGEGVVFTGQVFRTADEPAISPNGGIPSFEPYDAGYDAGVAALIAAGVPDGTATVEIAVTEATVVATSFNNDTALRAQSQFYIADANGTIEVRLAQEVEAQPAFPIIVGQKISFTATEMGWFGDFPQVAAGTGFTLVSEGNPVSIYEPEGDTPLTFADAPRVVRITGELVADEGACGGSSFCYTFDYGATENITLRSSSSFLEVGDCATFVGPMSSFNEAPQVNTTNFDWLFDYTRNE
jgi:hypothetical protein